MSTILAHFGLAGQVILQLTPSRSCALQGGLTPRAAWARSVAPRCEDCANYPAALVPGGVVGARKPLLARTNNLSGLDGRWEFPNTKQTRTTQKWHAVLSAAPGSMRHTVFSCKSVFIDCIELQAVIIPFFNTHTHIQAAASSAIDGTHDRD